jgi:hypothetical protein
MNSEISVRIGKIGDPARAYQLALFDMVGLHQVLNVFFVGAQMGIQFRNAVRHGSTSVSLIHIFILSRLSKKSNGFLVSTPLAAIQNGRADFMQNDGNKALPLLGAKFLF